MHSISLSPFIAGALLAQEVVTKSDIITIPVEYLQTTLYLDIVLSHMDDAIGLQVCVLLAVRCCLMCHITWSINIHTGTGNH